MERKSMPTRPNGPFYRLESGCFGGSRVGQQSPRTLIATGGTLGCAERPGLKTENNPIRFLRHLPLFLPFYPQFRSVLDPGPWADDRPR